ncbi:hypothetical protein DMUE_6399, partial [Dictyocoela muelleri]
VPYENLKNEIKKVDFFVNENTNIFLIKEFWDWFKKIYLKELYDNEVKFSIFSINFWSILNRVKLNIPKTNNNIERWHRSLNKNVSNAHPSIYEIGMEFKKQHAKVENNISRLIYCSPAIVQHLDKALLDIWKKYSSYYGMDYLFLIASYLEIKEF